ncbi:MAG: four helix bundle protein [Anaerolineaceae bacterium]|nr:MAG: four helix bundle protein [Anaerolineaceae bacterium]
MATIHCFEDLNAWQSAREITNLIYELTQGGNFAKDFGLRDQMRRAASSVMLNIAEGFDAGSDSEFIRFLGYARRSASETQAGLYTALDQKYISQPQFDSVYAKATICKKQINGLISYLHKSRSHSVKEPPSPYNIIIPEDN